MSDELDAATANFQETYQVLLAMVENYPEELREEAGACGIWSPREVIAHLSGWIIEAQHRYSQFARGIEGHKNYDHDAFNTQSITARKQMDWNATLSELRSLVRNLSSQAEAISLSRRDDPRYSEWLISLSEDCEVHMTELNEFKDV